MSQKKAYERIINVVQESMRPFFNELETGLHQKLAELEQSCGQIIDAQDKKISELQCAVEKQDEKIKWLLSHRYEVPINNTGMQYETKGHLSRTNHGGDVVGPDVDSARKFVKKLTGSGEVKDEL